MPASVHQETCGVSIELRADQMPMLSNNGDGCCLLISKHFFRNLNYTISPFPTLSLSMSTKKCKVQTQEVVAGLRSSLFASSLRSFQGKSSWKSSIVKWRINSKKTFYIAKLLVKTLKRFEYTKIVWYQSFNFQVSFILNTPKLT